MQKRQNVPIDPNVKHKTIEEEKIIWKLGALRTNKTVCNLL